MNGRPTWVRIYALWWDHGEEKGRLFYPQGAHTLVIYGTVWYTDPGSSIRFQRGLAQLGGQGALRGGDIWILKVGGQRGSESEGQRNHQRTGSQKEEHTSSRQDYWSPLGTQKYPLMATHVHTSKILNNLFITYKKNERELWVFSLLLYLHIFFLLNCQCLNKISFPKTRHRLPQSRHNVQNDLSSA